MPYAIVVGNPGRVVRFRFGEEIKDALLTSKWWNEDIAEIEPHIADFQQAFEKFYLSRKEAIKDEAQTKPCVEES